MYGNAINYSKPFSEMTEDEVTNEGMKAVRDYLEVIRKTRDFRLEECVRREMWGVEMLFRRACGLRPRDAMSEGQAAEWEQIRSHYLPLFTELTLSLQRDYVKASKLSRMNATTVRAIIPGAFSRVGLTATVTGQLHRALVEVTLPTSRVRFYIRYKDLEREGVMEDVVKSVLDLKDAMTRLGYGTVVRTRKDRDAEE